jgi:hypothetical protein
MLNLPSSALPRLERTMIKMTFSKSPPVRSDRPSVLKMSSLPPVALAALAVVSARTPFAMVCSSRHSALPSPPPPRKLDPSSDARSESMSFGSSAAAVHAATEPRGSVGKRFQ